MICTRYKCVYLSTVALLRHMDSGISYTDLCRPAVVLSHMSDLIEKHMGGTSGAVSTVKKFSLSIAAHVLKVLYVNGSNIVCQCCGYM